MAVKKFPIDDAGELINNFMTAFAHFGMGIREEVCYIVTHMLEKANFVPKGDFDTLKDLVIRQHTEIQALKKRLDNLEGN